MAGYSSSGSSLSVISAPGAVNMKIYYAAKAGMSVALCEHLSDIKLGEKAVREMLAQVS